MKDWKTPQNRAKNRIQLSQGTLFFDRDIKTETNKSNVQNYNRTAARKKKRNDCRMKEMTSRISIINRS